MKRIAVLAAAAATALLAACGGGDPLSAPTTASTGSPTGGGGGEVIVGSAAFPENELLAEIYAQALVGAGLTASTKPNIGEREVLVQALQDGSVTMTPEYTGGLLQYFGQGSDAKSSDEVYAAAKAALPPELTMLEKAPAEDKDSLTVTKEFADQNGLTTMSDLAKVADTVTTGGPSNFKTRPESGLPAIKEVYGYDLAPRFRGFGVSGAGTDVALKNGQIQVADLFTTDPTITVNGFVILEDDKNVFAAQNIVPLIRTDAVTDQVSARLNEVSAKITTESLGAALTRVVVDKEDASDVAGQWLTENGFGG